MSAQPRIDDDLDQLMAELEYRRRHSRIDLYYPETGLLRRDLYPKHMLTFALGKYHTVRVVRSGNRVGKTEGIGGYEITKHLTGEYPDWWPGRQFKRPVNVVAAGTSKESTRKIIQKKLLGDISRGELGTGMIPKRCLGQPRMRPNSNGAVEYIPVRHKSGLWSMLQFQSYEQGREQFEGFEADVCWLDEEPPLDIYSEVVMRLMDTTGGRAESGTLLVTFTPLKGTTAMVKAIDMMAKRGRVESGEDVPVKVQITWDDVPHLTDKAKQAILANVPEHEHEARATGAPILGSGAVYSVPLKDVVCKPFDLPKHWPRVYGLDVGWNCTACVWGAHDTENDVVYLYSEHYRGKVEPLIHATAIKARGEWIPGVIDKASKQEAQNASGDLFSEYRKLGLDIVTTSAKGNEHLLESGLMQVSTRLITGRLRVFDTMLNWKDEYSTYHRKDGVIPKGQDDHAMDATRYLIVYGLKRARVRVETYDPSPSAMTFGLYSEQ